MRAVAGVILPFPGGIVRSGSKVGSKYKGASASTNDAYLPDAEGRRRRARSTPDIASVLEIVIDGLTERGGRRSDARRASRRSWSSGRSAAPSRISAGNYGGKLGRHHYHLKELLP